MMTRTLVFHGVESITWLVICLAATLASVWLICVLLRDERRLVPRRVGHWLLALRLAAVALLLVTLLEPVLSWTTERAPRGRVIVAVDVSESMNVSDAQATPSEKLSWARGLDLIGNVQIENRLDRWREAYEAGREPVWVDESEISDPAERQELAAARRENLAELFSQLDRLSRKEIAQRLVAGVSAPLYQRLAEFADVQLVVFAGDAERIDLGELPETLSSAATNLRTDATDLARLLSRAKSEQAAPPLLGFVLLTDGQDNAGLEPVAVAARLGQVSVPVCPVPLGSVRPPKDLSIRSLDYPETALKDDVALLRATLGTTGFAGQEVKVLLEKDGDEPLVNKIVADGETARVEFRLDAAHVGRQEYTLRTEIQPGEVSNVNNRRAFAMNVVDDKVRILLVDGEARWEFRFIANALGRDERVALQSVVFRQPFLGVLKQPFFAPRLEAARPSEETGNSPFEEFDMVIVGDVAAHEMPEAHWESLEKYVADAGGTLVLLAGKHYFPLETHSPAVDRLLPLTNLRAADADGVVGIGAPDKRGFHLKLTQEGENDPVFQLQTERDENRETWAQLAGHPWGLSGDVKPASTVFARVARESGVVPADALGDAIIVEQRYGYGRVFWMGIDSTWRWRYRAGDTYHHRFWGQLGRSAAEQKAAVGNEFVRFGPVESDIEVGDEALVRALWDRSFLKRHPQIKARAEVYRADDAPEGDPVTTVELQPAAGRPLTYEGRVASLPEGVYRVGLAIDDSGDTAVTAGDISASLYVNERPGREMAELRCNRELLSRLAEVSGGAVVSLDRLSQLPERFVSPDERNGRRQETELWNHWLLLATFSLLLTIEWVIRRRSGLP